MTHPDPIDYPIPATLNGAMPTTPPDAARLRRARWATRGQFLALGLLSGIWGVHIPSVKAAFGLSEASLSWVLLAVASGAVLSLLVAGKVVGAWGARGTTHRAAWVMGSLLALALLWPSLGWLVAAMVLFGAAMSLFDVAINTEGSALEWAGGQPIMGNLHGSFSLGGMSGALLAGAMIRWEWPATWQLALAGAGLALWTSWSVRGMLPAHPLPEGEAASTPARHFAWPRGTLLVLGLLAFAGMSAEGAMYDWSVLYLQQEVGMPQARAAWGYAAFSGAMAAARFGGDALRQRHAEPDLLRAGALLCAVSMAGVLISAHPWVSLVGYAGIGAGLAMVVPLLYNAAARVPGQHRASAIATVSAIGYTGFLVGPPVVGSLAHATSLTWALALMVPMALLLAWGARHVPNTRVGHR